MIKTILLIIGVILILVAYKVLGEFENKLKQSRKDLELTVDDIKNIDKFLNQCVDYNNPYQEVLKRFNEYRQKK